MNVCVVGLGHLGQVTATCLARDHVVVGVGPRGPIGPEPSLIDLMTTYEASGTLRWAGVSSETLRAADVVWLTEDTPVDAHDHADVFGMLTRTIPILDMAHEQAVIILSSQVPCGTTLALARDAKRTRVAYIPENLKKGQGVQRFLHPERIVIGALDHAIEPVLRTLLAPYTQHLLFLSHPAAAEMTKHAINAHLAVNTTLTNEIADLCAILSVDPREVEAGLRSDARFGYGLPISPGGPIRGGTLLRDVRYLESLGRTFHVPMPVTGAIHASNDERLTAATEARRETLLRRIEIL